jgi:two-component system alkaline phosphatase synthesis response regulator PhoP
MARILVAEDDVHVMRLMSMWLTKTGHEVLEARNGAEAKTLVNEGAVDCLVTDVNMPVCDGVELVLWIREEADLHFPIVMLSARCDQDNLHERLKDMQVSVHPKPFSPSRLSAEIDEKLASIQARA